MAMCDQWWVDQDGMKDLEASRYLWLPVKLDPETGKVRMVYMEKWNPLHKDNKDEDEE